MTCAPSVGARYSSVCPAHGRFCWIPGPASSAGIFVADTGNNRIVRFNDMIGTGWTTLGGPVAGGGTNQFNRPRGVFVDTAGRIYVADTENNRIVRFNEMTGTGWTTLGGTSAGLVIDPDDELHSIAVDTAVRVYVGVNQEHIRPYRGGRNVRMNDMAGAGDRI